MTEVAIVTGAGQGIGLAIAKGLARSGAGVVLGDIDERLALEAAGGIRDSGGACEAFPGDASSLDWIDRCVGFTLSRFGKVTLAVANAGITSFGDFWEYRPEALRQVLDLNLSGSFFLAQRAARQMKSQGSGGSILLLSSVTGHQAHKHLAAYGMTKAGLEMLARSLVVELSPFGITINAVAPGATLTERTARDPAYADVWSKITPMGRPATVEDIAAAALFLLSPAARHITGQALVVDGGWTSVSPSPYEP